MHPLREKLIHMNLVLADRAGVSAIEYAFIASLISLAAISSYRSVGAFLRGLFHAVASSI